MARNDRSAPILLTGAHGQVGSELLPLLAKLGPVVAPLRGELDLEDLSAVRRFVADLQPRWIVNPAAFTAVDKAESEPEAAYRLNQEAVGVLGEEAARCGAVVLHFSTDYVFNGTGTRPWVETDTPDPLGVYGSSKLAGEHALAATSAAHIILRTSWVYGTGGKNFLKTILNAAQQRDELRIVDDQHGAPTWSRSLARMAATVIDQCEQAASRSEASLSEATADFSGVYHATDAGVTSWFGFAQRFLEAARMARPDQSWARCLPVPTTAYPTPAVRPMNSRLDCGKLERTFSVKRPHWQESTDAVMGELFT